MSEVLEFESPVKLTSEEVAERMRVRYPAAMAAAAEVKDVFGNGSQIVLMESDGSEYRHKTWKADDEYKASLTPTQFIRLGELSTENMKIAEEGIKRNARR